MKILYYSSHPNLGLNDKAGYGTHMREMIKAFEMLGHEVLPVIMGGVEVKEIDKKNQASDNFSLKAFLRKYTPASIWKTLLDIKLLQFDKKAEAVLKAKVAEFKPDLIYERGAYFQLSGVNVANNAGVKHILENNSPYVEESAVFERSRGYLYSGALKAEKELLEKTDKVLVVSTALKEYYVKKHKINPDKILVTPNCINLDIVKVDEKLKQKISDKYDLQNKIIIGFVGSIFPYHGVDNLIEAFSVVSKNRPDIKLMIVGDGETLQNLKKRASDLKIDVIFTGSVKHKDVFTYIDLMDITVMPKSNWYGSPIKIFEYGSLGKAVIAPDNVPVRDVMVNKIDGLLIEETIEGLTNALNQFLDNEILRKSTGIAFRRKIENHYTWKKIAEEVLSDEM
jgi:glycosyltransferase involved in cell wall biosynthesis